jgi:hypothetical protein
LIYFQSFSIALRIKECTASGVLLKCRNVMSCDEMPVITAKWG